MTRGLNGRLAHTCRQRGEGSRRMKRVDVTWGNGNSTGNMKKKRGPGGYHAKVLLK